uniref:Colipase-like 2 n=1 Tax=Rattus norvegicus TaxID=10116 RepID=A0ABK0LZ22_RAT
TQRHRFLGNARTFCRQELVTKGLFLQANGDKCVHHSQCFSDCCLIDLERSGAFCTSKSHVGMACLPQTKRSLNILCPCRIGLSCHSKDPMCPRRCQMI